MASCPDCGYHYRNPPGCQCERIADEERRSDENVSRLERIEAAARELLARLPPCMAHRLDWDGGYNRNPPCGRKATRVAWDYREEVQACDECAAEVAKCAHCGASEWTLEWADAAAKLAAELEESK